MKIPYYTAWAVRKWFLSTVATMDKDLFHDLNLHDGQHLRPYTISNILGKDDSWFRITSCDARLTQFLINKFAPTLINKAVVFANIPLIITEVIIDAQDHEWARHGETYESLLQHYTLSDERLDRKVMLKFASPTTFTRGNKDSPLPNPDLVFGSLADRWTAFAPVSLDPNFRIFCDEYIACNRYHNLYTRFVKFGSDFDGEKADAVGFSGEVEFKMLEGNRYWRGVLHLLAQYAFYAGVGSQTSWGFGQVNPIRHFSRQR